MDEPTGGGITLSSSPLLTQVKPTVEWTLPIPTLDIRQGDVLLATDADATSLSNLLFVLTADCDLAYSKHHGRLLCVPIVPLRDYIAKFRLITDVEQYASELGKHITNRVDQIRTSQGLPTLDSTRILEWISEESTETILATLNVADAHHDRATLSNMMDHLRLSQAVPQQIEPQIEWLQQCRFLIDPKCKSEVGSNLAIQRIRDLIKQPPRDIHLLAEVSPHHKEGYVLALRFPQELFHNEVTLNQGDESTSYRRLSRTCSPYVYSIAQRFGLLYTAVGLPDNHHESVRLSAELLIENIAVTKGKF